MKGIKWLIGLIVLVMLGSTIGAAMKELTKQNIPLKPPEELTKKELQIIYRVYNVTENDIKFARGELPYVLKGTILDGSKRVIITKDGKLSERVKKKIERIGYDLVISKKKAIEICEKAKREYIKKYGVDPANPKVIMYKGIPLPKEYIKELVRRGIIKPPESSDIVQALSTDAPHQINGKIYVEVFVAKDDAHRPDKPLLELMSDTSKALTRFEEEFNVSMEDTWYIGFWDASDVPDVHNTSQVLKDLEEDCSWAQNADNEIVFGWADDLDHNGRAYQPGFYAVGAETPTHPFDYPDNIVVQHEISHNFNAPDHGYIGPYCVMTYLWAYLGVDVWCSDCWKIIHDTIWSS